MSLTRLQFVLLVAAAINVGLTAAFFAIVVAGADGLLINAYSPLGGDFINMFAAARMVLGGHAGQVYIPDAFMAFEHTIIDAYIGLRLWAYPPHSLLMVWPLGFMNYGVALAAWSAIGLVVLGYGARRFGFSAIETAMLVCSPAAMQSVYYGQTGNMAAGLMLAALAASTARPVSNAVSAAILTIKPQTGFLLPVLWLAERRWLLIGATSALVAALLVATLAVFGPGVFAAYFGDTLPALGTLERQGHGAFMLMIPTVFMSARILGASGAAALGLHAVFALAIGALLVVRLLHDSDGSRRAGLVLAATCVMTPYLHVYDLGLATAGAALLMRRHAGSGAAVRVAAGVVAALVWLLPILTYFLNQFGAPVAPVILVALFLAL